MTQLRWLNTGFSPQRHRLSHDRSYGCFLLQNADSILRASTKYPKEMGALRNKSGDEIIVILDCKATDLKKKLDQLRHESNKVHQHYIFCVALTNVDLKVIHYFHINHQTLSQRVSGLIIDHSLVKIF